MLSSWVAQPQQQPAAAEPEEDAYAEVASWLRALVHAVAMRHWVAENPHLVAELEDRQRLQWSLEEARYARAHPPARALGAPMDSLALACAFSARELKAATAIFAAEGLVIQGATCTPPQGLAPLAADAPTFSTMPTLHFAWVDGSAPPLYAAERSARVSLYADSERETLLSELVLPCDGYESQWVQAGVALMLC